MIGPVRASRRGNSGEHQAIHSYIITEQRNIAQQTFTSSKSTCWNRFFTVNYPLSFAICQVSIGTRQATHKPDVDHEFSNRISIGISFTLGGKTGISIPLQRLDESIDTMRLSHTIQLALNPLHRGKIGCGTTTSGYSISARLMPHIIAGKKQQGLSFHAGHGISLV